MIYIYYIIYYIYIIIYNVILIYFRLACGIIARSSTLFQNTKKICACDGLTLWDERDKTFTNKYDYSKSSNNCTVF